MGKRKTESPPVLELVPEPTTPSVGSQDIPSSPTDNCELDPQGHVGDRETIELHPFWLLLSDADYEIW